LAIYKRLPSLRQITSVYAVIVLAVYSWTILHFFWKLTGWLYYLSIGEILTILAYSLTVNLFESLLVLCIPLGLSLFLPRIWFANTFVSSGVIIAITVLGYSAFLLTQFQSSDGYPNSLVRLIPIVFIASVIFAILASKAKLMLQVIDFFAEQATIFLYVSIPLSLISIVVVLVRIVF